VCARENGRAQQALEYRALKIAIVGAGVVGQGMKKIFKDAVFVDPAKGFPQSNGDDADLAVICVPTPIGENGVCYTYLVLQAIREAKAKLILVKSTVQPGTCDAISAVTGKCIVFSPEYMGESKYWTPAEFPQPTDPVGHGFVILGGETRHCAAIADILLPILGPCTRFRFMSAKDAEIVKYAENAFFAMKVWFATQLRDICNAAGAQYHTVREGWLDDPRVGPMHTAAFANDRGFGGKCLPKDTMALAHYMRTLGLSTDVLDAVLKQNGRTL